MKNGFTWVETQFPLKCSLFQYTHKHSPNIKRILYKIILLCARVIVNFIIKSKKIGVQIKVLVHKIKKKLKHQITGFEL